MKVGLVSPGAQLDCGANARRAAETLNPATPASPEVDKLDLSQSATQFKQLLEAAKRVPDVREDKVQDIKSRIQAGEYNVDSRVVAEKMLEQLGRDTR